MATTVAPATRPVNTPDWIAGVLNGIGAPITTTNVEALKLWAGAEGTKAQYNPLATTEPGQGASNFNSVGVKNYPSEAVGVQATVSTLNQQNMAGIKNALVQGDNLSTIIAAINSSPWGSHIGSGTTPQSGESTTGATLTSETGSAGCNASGGIGGLGITLLSGCQLKALKGGALALAGGILLLAGTVLIVAKTGLGKKAVEATGVGFVAEKVVGARQARASTVDSQPSAAEMSGDPNRPGSASSRIKPVSRPGPASKDFEPFPDE